MNQHLQNILNSIKPDKNLSEEEKNAIIKSLKDADKEFEITSFKLDRTEKVKRTTAILLEETIEELEQKRKAVEAQNRELEIESSLERVRTVAMSMNNREDMLLVCRIIAEQLALLNINDIRNVQTAIFYEERGTYMNYEYYAKHNKTFVTETTYTDHEIAKAFAAKMLKGRGEISVSLIRGSEKVREWLNYQKNTNVFIDAFLETANSVNYYWFSLGPVALGISTYTELNEEELRLFKRFLNVFELAYRRFLDIEKAETQAREAQIEAAVERVRAQSMAMRQTTDLHKVNEELLNQLQLLKVAGLSGVSIYLIDEEGEVVVWDLSSPGNIGDPNSYTFKFSSKKYPVLGELWYHFKISGDYFTLDYPLEKLKAAIPEFREIDNVIADAVEEAINSGNLKYQWNAFGKITNGVLGIDLMSPPSDDTKTIVLKMAGAFNLAYKRFLDLQKAEAQARESQIEAALERVRSRTMAMQHSGELAETSLVLFKQIKELGFKTWSCGFCTWQKDDMVELWMGADSGGLLPPMMIPYKKEPTHKNIYEASLTGVHAHDKIWEGRALGEHYAFLKTIPSVKDAINILEASGLSLPERQCYYVGFFEQGYLLLITKDSNDELKMLSKRFANVFNQTYTRFIDLQKSEAQAKESQVEVALERVRSRTLAMQNSHELAETAAVLFRQLILLGIQPSRLYIAIIKDDDGNAEFWITDEDGSKVSSAFETNLHNNVSFKKMFDGWKAEKKSLIIDMQAEELQEYFKYLSSIHVTFKNGLIQKRRVQDIAYFSQGFIGMASPDVQPAETLQLLERFAYTFNLTFTRFNDLKLAEAHAIQAKEDLIKLQTEKKRAEDALTELRSTQTQLIQSEKMASLGELTAGIAHEIQNPLNFVNNFSEVNAELIDELKTEKAKPKAERDEQLEEELLNDIVQNLEKINHHGKRADAIVKGMLQHSRTTSSTKESTDINKLVDEYLRLAYHGIRAKDNSFNATLKTDYDETIGNINVIPQDIGRVILNLITNAFYAVDERKKSYKLSATSYEPTVTIRTKKQNGKTEIQVTDNGNGIPDSIKEKIFQPFFTTKPTGQGTGLGLSLAYDIVKAHAGELKMETKENKGAAFIIQLPIN